MTRTPNNERPDNAGISAPAADCVDVGVMVGSEHAPMSDARSEAIIEPRPRMSSVALYIIGYLTGVLIATPFAIGQDRLPAMLAGAGVGFVLGMFPGWCVAEVLGRLVCTIAHALRGPNRFPYYSSIERVRVRLEVEASRVPEIVDNLLDTLDARARRTGTTSGGGFAVEATVGVHQAVRVVVVQLATTQASASTADESNGGTARSEFRFVIASEMPLWVAPAATRSIEALKTAVQTARLAGVMS